MTSLLFALVANPLMATLAPSSSLPTGSVLPQSLSLNGEWRLTQADRKIDVPAIVPGVVQTALLRAGLIPDPYLGENEKEVQWVSDEPWTYSRSITISSEFLGSRRIVMRCEGLDTFATIRINGQEVAKTDNFFRTWELDVKPYLHEGENALRIDFEPLGSFLKRNEGRFGEFDMPIQEGGKPYIRKPGFQGGWDFAPKILTTGIWRKLSLICWDAARLTDVAVAQDHSKPGEVGLTVQVSADVAGATTAHTTVSFKGKKVAESTAVIHGESAESKIAISKPQLWWPNELGPQNLYDVDVELLDKLGKVVDQGKRRIGLRTVTWIPKSDTSPLALVVNGRRIFAKGSNWVPYDSMLREDPEGERRLIKKAVDAHMNLMRIWGGGYYADDAFFDACDEMGLMAWFEFGYANSPYPSFDPRWLANARIEAEDNVRRTRNHPCLAVYSGNNEVTDRIAEKPSSWQIGVKEYELLFRVTLRDVVNELAPTIPYTPGSPEIGDTHHWGVWHGADGFDAYLKLHGFMSEFGFQAIPVPRTIEAFTTPTERSSFGTPAMLNHQKNWRDAYALMVSTMRRSYRRPKDFDSTIWLSQIQQAAGITLGVEHWRRDWPNSSASLVWQFNDPWPGSSWSMVDYYQRPKALYYRLKQAYAPIALSTVYDAEHEKCEFWVANDRAAGKQGVIEWSLFKLNGDRVRGGRLPAVAKPGTSSNRVATLDLPLTAEARESQILMAVLRMPGEPDSPSTLLFASPKSLDLAEPRFHASIEAADAGAFRVTVTSPVPALYVWLDVAGADADYSENFFDLQPSRPKTVLVRPHHKSSLAEIRSALRVRSLQDTYSPGEGPSPIVRQGIEGGYNLAAEDADIVGGAAYLEGGSPGNIGNWVKVEDGLNWDVEGLKAGRYRVTAEVAIPDSEAGSEFSFEIQGQKVGGKVPPTGGWYTYKVIELGEIELKAADHVRAHLQPLSKVSEHVMNLRSIRLIPRG